MIDGTVDANVHVWSSHDLAAVQVRGYRRKHRPDRDWHRLGRHRPRRPGLKGVALPTCSVADKPINTGGQAKCFASYIRIHALEATGGRTYSQMGQYLTAAGKETSDKAAAAIDPKTGKPVPNAARNIWVTATALTTALNTSYFAESVALFAIVMGVALLLIGIGLVVLSVWWLREPGNAVQPTPTVAPKPVVA